MSMKTKRIILLLLSALLVLAMFTSCMQKETEEGTTTDDTGDPEVSKIKWKGTISYAPYMFAPIEKDEVTPLIKEKLLEYGYDVDIQPVYIENSQYTELLNLRIAAKEAPDMFIAGSYSRMTELYDQGAIASWDKQFFIDNAPTIYSYIQKGGYEGRLERFTDMWWELSTVDGKMLTLPNFEEQGSMINKAVIYREDWLDNLGVKDLPYTLDEFTDLMRKFAKEDPNKSGKDDTYGYSSSMVKIVFSAYDGWVGYPGGAPQWYNKDGGAICADLFPSNKDALAYLANHYKEGLLDPEYITGENEGGYWALSHAFINGKIGVSAHASIDHYRLPEVLDDEGGPCTIEWAAANPDAGFVYGPWIAGPTGNYGYLIGYGASISENSLYDARLNSDTEKLAAIFAIKDLFSKDDYLASLAGWGIEGKHYKKEMVDGKEVIMLLFPNEELNNKGVWAQRTFSGDAWPFNENYFRINFYNNPTIANRFDIQAQKQYGGGYVSDIYMDLPSTGKYRSELVTYRDETFTKIITGELGVDYWDTFVAEWNKRGGDVLTKEANEFFKK